MTLGEWISKLDNEECDKLSQTEQLELKDMLIESYKKGYKDGWNSCISDKADGWMVDYI